jgi:PAS domain S-box-containing protein
MRNALAVHSLQKEQQTAEQSLRKLSRAVEQSANTIIVTDLRGIIEYVNPAFETLTGYQHDEVFGKTPRILKSGEQS